VAGKEIAVKKYVVRLSAGERERPVGGKPFGFDGERRVGRTGHSERLLALASMSKGQGRRPETPCGRRVTRRPLNRGAARADREWRLSAAEGPNSHLFSSARGINCDPAETGQA
jgi:hypothetical protein